MTAMSHCVKCMQCCVYGQKHVGRGGCGEKVIAQYYSSFVGFSLLSFSSSRQWSVHACDVMALMASPHNICSFYHNPVQCINCTAVATVQLNPAPALPLPH